MLINTKMNLDNIYYEPTTEEQKVFSHREYIGKGEYKNHFTTEIKTNKARYSNTVNDEMIEKVNKYIKEERPDAKIIIE